MDLAGNCGEALLLSQGNPPALGLADSPIRDSDSR